MATKDLSNYKKSNVPSGEDFTIGIVVSEWNEEVTSALLKGAVSTLRKHGVGLDSLVVEYVPGAFELTYGASLLTSNYGFDAVIVLGCVIQGETRHFEYICQSVTAGITELNLQSETPVIFGVLTTDTLQQALDRAGGKLGNKGDEAAITALKMAALNHKYNNDDDDDFDYDDDDDDDDDTKFLGDFISLS